MCVVAGAAVVAVGDGGEGDVAAAGGGDGAAESADGVGMSLWPLY